MLKFSANDPQDLHCAKRGPRIPRRSWGGVRLEASVLAHWLPLAAPDVIKRANIEGQINPLQNERDRKSKAPYVYERKLVLSSQNPM